MASTTPVSGPTASSTNGNSHVGAQRSAAEAAGLEDILSVRLPTGEKIGEMLNPPEEQAAAAVAKAIEAHLPTSKVADLLTEVRRCMTLVTIEASRSFYILFVLLKLLKQVFSSDASMKYPTLDNFQVAYDGAFNSRSVEEQLKLRNTANWMHILFQIIPAKKNKGLVLAVVSRFVEGFGVNYITGSGQTEATADRVRLYETEGGIVPMKRLKHFKTKSLVSGKPRAPKSRPHSVSLASVDSSLTPERESKRQRVAAANASNPSSSRYQTSSRVGAGVSRSAQFDKDVLAGKLTKENLLLTNSNNTPSTIIYPFMLLHEKASNAATNHTAAMSRSQKIDRPYQGIDTLAAAAESSEAIPLLNFGTSGGSLNNEKGPGLQRSVSWGDTSILRMEPPADSTDDISVLPISRDWSLASINSQIFANNDIDDFDKEVAAH